MNETRRNEIDDPLDGVCEEDLESQEQKLRERMSALRIEIERYQSGATIDCIHKMTNLRCANPALDNMFPRRLRVGGAINHKYKWSSAERRYELVVPTNLTG